ncbi:MAG TPA: AbrB/MazE/SpoVT family DNA-binding domain-containing protein [Acidobacteriota bacterium]
MYSRISSKGQVTIPKAARQALGASAGDLVSFEISDDAVVLRKIEPFDAAFHRALSVTLDEWTSPEDEEAFGDL